MSTPDLSSLGTEVVDLGILIGLLQGTQSSPSLNTDWFSNPEKGLQDGFNWPNLQPIAESILGKADNPLNTNAGPFYENWYSIKINDDNGEPVDSGFYLVQKTSGNNALLGIGIQKVFRLDVGAESINITPFAFIPIFQMPAKAGVTPIFDIDLNGPVEIGIEVNYSDTFTVNSTAYNGMIFVASFDFTSNAPTLQFLLSQPEGDFEPFPTIDLTTIFNTVLSLAPVKSFLDSNILPKASPVQFTWGGLFNAVGWLSTAKAPYSVGSINIPDAPGALKTYIETVLLNTFNKFFSGSSSNNTVIKLLSSGKPKKEGDPEWLVGLVVDNGHYGINVQVSNIKVSSSPVINLQIGALTSDETDWIKEAGGTSPTGLGLNFFVLSGTTPANIKFDPHFEALSIGLDISKADDQPLFDVKGYSIKEAQLRGYFSTLQDNAWGVAAAVNNIALPLGPPASSAGNSVPQTLLASADQPEGGEQKGDAKPVVNPEFSFLAAYLDSFYFQLFDKDGKPEEIVTIPLQKSFGPIALQDVGIGWKGSPDYTLLFQLDGGLNLNALKLNLDKLTVGIPVKTPGTISNYTLDLDGMDLSFVSGSVSIAGGFLKDDTVTPTQYNGAVSIQAAKWGIMAMGSFASLDSHPSLFIFGLLNGALGGPPFFFVTGVAVGFGYNRSLVIPAIDQVQNFPFVKAAVSPELFSGDKANDVLATISQYVPPQLGQYWFAAGVKFTSFELLSSFALLVLQFGKQFEINLLGLTTLQLPKQYADAKLHPYVNAEMAIKATVDPTEGVLSVEAQLTANSYVIDPGCKITGGFAYYSWFDGPNAGDFVVTMGGYNQNFTPPNYYPSVPRLGFNWNVSSNITLSGEAYFALTPSCVMAGGKLALVYQDGDLQAWFKAFADFLISWNPFHYDIGIGISIGVSYRINVLFIHKTITVELGVNVQIWGPQFGGQAEVHLWIISFTVNFGAGNTSADKTIEWADFEKYFLPGNDTQPKTYKGVEALTDKDDSSDQIIKINISAGLKEKITLNNIEYWVVDPGSFVFNAESSIPATQIRFAAGPDGPTDIYPTIPCNPFGLKPLGNYTLKGSASDFVVQLQKQEDTGGSKFLPYSVADWEFTAVPKKVPKALWGTINNGKETPSADSVPDITSGLATGIPPVSELSGPDEFPQSALNFTTISDEAIMPFDTTATLTQLTLSSEGSLDQIKSTLNDPESGQKQRGDIFEALTQLGSLAKNNDDLAAMALAPEDIFQGSPMLANTGSAPKALAAKKPLVNRTSRQPRFNALLGGHKLKTTLISYQFGPLHGSGSVLRGGNYNTMASKMLNARRLESDTLRIFNMVPGMLQIWELDPLSNTDQLLLGGSLPMRMVLFDKNREIIADSLLQTSQNQKISIPADATEMCLQALDLNASDTLCGWHQGSYLSLLNSKYLMGNACLIRSKNPQRVGYKQYSHDTGLINGRSVVLNNKKAKDSTKPNGWIETRFAADVKQVFVLARPEWETPESNDLQFNLKVRLIYTDTAGNKQSQTLNTELTGINGNELWAGFNVPAIADSDGYFSIWAEAGDDISLAGVAGAVYPLESWTEALSNQLIGHQAGLNAKNSDQQSSVKLSNALNF